jgi:ATP/maltotriose-dependent transcriptional regulator MalT
VPEELSEHDRTGSPALDNTAWVAHQHGLIEESINRLDQTPRRSSEALAILAEREREIPGEVARGWSNGDSGAELHISSATAQTHVGQC